MSRWFAASTACVLVFMTACTDPLLPPDQISCDSRGRLYSGTIGARTWGRAASPHVITDTVDVQGTLRIQPGTVICGTPGAVLVVDTLVAAGTEGLPIRFSAAGAQAWDGIRVRGVATIQHTLIESAARPVADDAASNARITIEDSHIRGSHGSLAAAVLTLRRVDVDSACIGAPTCSAVNARPYGTTTLEQVRIRDSGGYGVSAVWRCSLALNDVTIEGSTSVGLYTPYVVGGTCGFQMNGRVRVTGGKSYGVVGWAPVLALLHPDHVADITGNALDTLVVQESFGAAQVHVTKDVALRMANCPGQSNVWHRTLPQLVIDAGATVTIGGGCLFRMDLRMHGTEAEPATLRGAGVRIHSSLALDTARVQHARLHGVRIRADSGAIVFENVQMDSSSLELMHPGSRINGLRATGSALLARSTVPRDTEDPATVTLGAGTHMTDAVLEDARLDGIQVLGDATVRDCTITRSGRDGVRIHAGLLSIQRCNLTGNTGAGVNNAGTTTADASDNWWGDAAGPLGPNGDGVEGSVSYSPWRTEPVTWTAAAATLSFSRRFRR